MEDFWKVPRGHLLVDLQNRKNLCWVILFSVWCLKKIKTNGGGWEIQHFNSFFWIFNLPHLRSIYIVCKCVVKRRKRSKENVLHHFKENLMTYISYTPETWSTSEYYRTKLNEEIGRKYLISIKHIDHPSCFTFDSLVTNDFWRDPSLWDWFHKNTIWNLIL